MSSNWKMISKTYRFKLTVVYTSVVLFLFSVFGMILYLKYGSMVDDNLNEYLLREARDELVHEINSRLAWNAGVIKRYGDEYYEVVNRKGEVLITSLSAESPQWPLHRDPMMKAFKGVPQFITFAYRGDNFRMLYFPVSEDRILRVAVSLAEVQGGMRNLRRLFLFLSPVIVIISSGLSWVLSGKALAPIVRITSLAEQVRQGRLDTRIDMALKGKEIDDLVRIFNEMLTSIQRSVDAQKRFTSDVSHEIRSPLTSLRGGIEVALRKRRTAEEYEELLRSNLADIMRLSRITDNLLFFARADNNIVELRKQWFDINHMIWGVTERMRYKAESAGVTVNEEYEEGLELYGDMDLLEQAISNIIDNALKYTPSGGMVTVRSSRQGDALQVDVSDTGIGIPESDMPHVFERFYRVSKERSRKSGGTGLGLAITHWIISAHRGTISVRSAQGSGSVFTITLPLTSE